MQVSKMAAATAPTTDKIVNFESAIRGYSPIKHKVI